MGVGLRDYDTDAREITWRRHCTQPTHRPAKAMRQLLGLTPIRAARLAGIRFDQLGAFETGLLDGLHWPHVATQLDRAYRGLGASWCEPDLHEGAYCVHLKDGSADDRQAIKAAIALMGHTAGKRSRKVTVGQLADRAAKGDADVAKQLRRALAGDGSERLTQRQARLCFSQLGEGRGGAGCYFVPAPLGGWRGVGCDWAGCWW